MSSGPESNDMGGTLVRSVGLAGEGAERLKNLAYRHAPPGPTGASRGGRVTILGEGDRLGTVLSEITQLERGRPRKSRLRHGWSW